MTKDSVNNNLENRIAELEKKIEKYNKAYYDENKSLVSDWNIYGNKLTQNQLYLAMRLWNKKLALEQTAGFQR